MRPRCGLPLERGIPLTPRAAGTNLTGSAIGSGIILDVSRMNRILEVNEEERWARVQPGMVLAELNKQLGRRHPLLFGPDPSSGDMCKLGGMVANKIPPGLTRSSMAPSKIMCRRCASVCRQGPGSFRCADGINRSPGRWIGHLLPIDLLSNRFSTSCSGSGPP